MMLLGGIGNATPGISMIPARKMCTFVRPLALWDSTVDEATVLIAGNESAVAEPVEEHEVAEPDVPMPNQQPTPPSPLVLGEAMVELGQEQREDPVLKPIIDWATGN